jgi:predicted esterase
MGAMHTIDLVQKHAGKFAGAAVLGGGGTVKDAKTFANLPLFIGVGDKDFLLAMARELNKTLTTGGAKRVTFQEYEGIEHMVIVREALPDVFEMFDGVAGRE